MRVITLISTTAILLIFQIHPGVLALPLGDNVDARTECAITRRDSTIDFKHYKLSQNAEISILALVGVNSVRVFSERDDCGDSPY
ncbi:hypothetical protein DFP72DRAFT_941233 [Ephemerocybe angulata]|uniref:Uncharacterized protein n=1 Tax=Ephemerocybe angulata TaxID=980116 RepID=A0A8H6LTQ5_9AGAR|nr:hypothetical protein DFP72DRAFT_941233 [Tulosesus angulatus]